MVLCVYEYVIIVLRMLCTVHVHGKFQNIRFRIYTYVVYGVSDQLVKLLLESAWRYNNYHARGRGRGKGRKKRSGQTRQVFETQDGMSS